MSRLRLPLCLVASLIASVALYACQSDAPADTTLAPIDTITIPVNQATTPAPGDYNWWQGRFNRLLDVAKKGNIDLVFLGDSITAQWRDAPDVWAKYYEPRHAVNFGIGGDRTEQILYRIEHGNFDDLDPKLIVLMIGTNNNNTHNTPEQIADGVIAVVKQLHDRMPNTKILMLAIFPRGKTADDPLRINNQKANAIFRKIADHKTIFYLDIGDAFENPDGSLDPKIMPDYLHMYRSGYVIWARAMEPTLARLMGDTPIE